jgi:hypothetical protein
MTGFVKPDWAGLSGVRARLGLSGVRPLVQVVVGPSQGYRGVTGLSGRGDIGGQASRGLSIGGYRGSGLWSRCEA